jgi:hypothetical protein
VVELILDEETPSPEHCSVVWLGKRGCKQEGEVGLETVCAIIRGSAVYVSSDDNLRVANNAPGIYLARTATQRAA